MAYKAVDEAFAQVRRERLAAKIQYDPYCRRCNGKGEYEVQRDLHKSAGIVPCDCAAIRERGE